MTKDISIAKQFSGAEFEDTLQKGRKMVSDNEKRIQDNFEDLVYVIKLNITDVGKTINETATYVTNFFDRADEAISNYTDDPLRTVDTYALEYGKYR